MCEHESSPAPVRLTWPTVGGASAPPSQFRVRAASCGSALTRSVKVAAVQQVAVCSPHVPVQRCVLLDPWESYRRLIEEQLQPRAALAVIQHKEKVSGVRNNVAGPEASTCNRKRTIVSPTKQEVKSFPLMSSDLNNVL